MKLKLSELNWQAAMALFALLAVSFLLPGVLSPLLVLLFLFFLPGYILVRVISPELSQLEELALSILASIMVSSYAIYFLGLLMGYSTTTFYLFFAFSSISALFVNRLPKIIANGLGRSDVTPLVLAAATGFIVFLILQLSLWVPTSTGVIVGGWNYGDYFLHVSVMQSVNQGNFPPQEPIYAGEPLAYHWLIDLHTAVASKLLQMFPSFPSVVDSTVGVGLLSLLTYLFAFHFTKSQKASLLAAFLLVFAGGFGYLRLADEVSSAPLASLVRGDAFDNHGNFFQLPSMLPGFLLPQRPMLVGIPALAAVLLLVSSGYPSDTRRLLLAGVILGMMPPFQYYAFLAAALASALYFAYAHASTRSLKHVERAFYVIIPSLIFAFPFLLGALGRAGGMTKIGVGWLAPKNDAFEFIKFYTGNFGLAFLLAFPGFFAFKSKSKLFLALAIALLFIIPNVITFSNTQWDMGKFFMLMMLPVAVLAGAAIAKLSEWVWPILLLFCCLSPLLASVFYLTCGWHGLSSEEITAGVWIQQNTPQRAVFASSSVHNTPIDAVGGRLRVLGYRWWVTNYGLDFDSRFTDLKTLYCGSRSLAPQIMQEYNATYVYLSAAEVREYGCTPSFEGLPGFSREYTTPQIVIYHFTNS